MITDGDWETRKGRTNWEMRRRQWSCTGFPWWWYWSWRRSGSKEGRIATSPKCPTYTTRKSLHGKPSTKLIPWTISGCFVEWVVSEQAKQCRSKQCICIVWQCRAGLNLDLLRRILASCDAHLGPTWRLASTPPSQNANRWQGFAESLTIIIICISSSLEKQAQSIESNGLAWIAKWAYMENIGKRSINKLQHCTYIVYRPRP